MGIFSDWAKGRQSPIIESAATFTANAQDLIGGADIDPAVFGLTTYLNPTSPAPRIDRRSAIQVPAVKRVRDLIAGTLGGLPVDLIGPDNVRGNYGALLEQPERNVPKSVTYARLFEDMLFEGVAWWLVVEFGWHNYPTKVRRLRPGQVTVDETTGVVLVDGKKPADGTLIRFDSPTDALLVAGARAIRTCLNLDAAAARAADGTPPMEYFTPATEVDPFDTDEEVKEFLGDWKAARQERTSAYVPAAVKLNVHGWNPEQLQLADARQHAVLEIARVGGVDPEELGVSTTSRTYANAFDRRKNFTDFTIGQYRQAFEDRLSMGDITPGGYVARQNLDAFLRSDPKTRMETYALGLEVGAYDGRQEVRHLEGGAPLTQPAPVKEAPVAPVAADQPAGDTFDDADPAIRLDAPQDAAAFAVDVPRRTISGLAVPYGVVGLSNGQRWQFSQGTLKFADAKRVKLWIGHDKTKAIGYATELDDRPEGLFATFSVAPGPEGDHALAMADHGTWDGLSVGLKQGGKFQNRAGVNHAVEAPLMEVSLTPAPSFDDARTHAVAASADQEGTPMKCTKCNQVHVAGVVDCDATAVAQFAAENAGPAFDAAAITEAIAAGFAGLTPPAREVIDPAGGGGSFEVTEQPVYRFDGHPGQFSLVDDMSAGARGDSEARQRVDQFMGEAFAVTTGNAASLNPTKNRPELYVPNLQFSRPLWEMVSTGSIDDKTPFTIPKFAAAAGLVANHVEGVEPTPGSFSATSQTVSPGAVSGKIEVLREVLDQGGSPQADQIIWGEILNAWYEALEARIATALAAVPTTEVNLASAVDAALVNQIQSVLVGLQFARGGNRFTGLALDGMLFPALVNAADTSGRKLLPVLGATNAQGEVSGAFDRVSIGGLTGRAAWALGSATTSKSYLFVPSSVYAWASAPKRFTFEYQLKSVDIGIWGYAAAAITRDTDVRPIDYTVAD